MAKTNPNNANQYVLDPRQDLCWELYINPESATFANGLKSAIKAGYSASHAKTITTETWFQDKVRRLGMLSKAEKVLDETLEMDDQEDGRRNPAITKIKQDTAKFVAESVGKAIYSKRTELSGPGGKDLIPPSPLLGGKSNGDTDNGDK